MRRFGILCACPSASFAPSLRSLRLLFKGGNAEDAKTSPVSSYPRRRVSRATGTNPACRPESRITSGMAKFSQIRILTLRSGASRRGSLLEAPRLQPLLRDGASAPPQDENEAVWNIVCQPLFVPVRMRQYICWPPLMDRVEPVMNPPSSETRNFTPRAISEAWPRRPTGILATILSSTSAGTARTMSVSI